MPLLSLLCLISRNSPQQLGMVSPELPETRRQGHCLYHLAAPRWMMAWAEDRAPWQHDPTRPERRPRDQNRGGRHDPARFSPSGLVRKRQIGPRGIRYSVPLIVQPRFLHFTVNHKPREPIRPGRLARSAARSAISVEPRGIPLTGTTPIRFSVRQRLKAN